jgi:hypothetical protein
VCVCVCVCVYTNNCMKHIKLKFCRFIFNKKFLNWLHLVPLAPCPRVPLAPCPRVAVFDEFHRTISPVESAIDVLPHRTLHSQNNSAARLRKRLVFAATEKRLSSCVLACPVIGCSGIRVFCDVTTSIEYRWLHTEHGC